MPIVDKRLMDQAITLKIKVDIMQWLDLFSEPYGSIVRMQSTTIIDAFNRDHLSDGILNFIIKAMKSLTEILDDDLKRIRSFMEGDECHECGKCQDLKEIITMILNNENIDEVQQRMKQRWESLGGPPIEISRSLVPTQMTRENSEPVHIRDVIESVLMTFMKSMRSNESGSMEQPFNISELFDDMDFKVPPTDKKKLH